MSRGPRAGEREGSKRLLDLAACDRRASRGVRDRPLLAREPGSMCSSLPCLIAPAGSVVNSDTPVRAVEIDGPRPGPTHGKDAGDRAPPRPGLLAANVCVDAPLRTCFSPGKSLFISAGGTSDGLTSALGAPRGRDERGLRLGQ